MKIDLGSYGAVNVDPLSVETADLEREEYTIGGVRLTDELADQIVVDVMRRRGKQGGRPPLSADGTSQLGVRIPADLRAKLKNRAGQLGVTESQAARDILAEALAA